MKRLFDMPAIVRRVVALVLLLFAVGVVESSAQHTLAVTGGSGMATARLYPDQEMRAIWGTYAAGLSWRYYTDERFVGGVGVDIELLQRGYSFAPYPQRYENKNEYRYYTRKLNSIMVPLVWQPHAYLFKNHLRLYLEAAVTFSYSFSSTFFNDEKYAIDFSGAVEAPVSGKYEFRPERDNRFAFGLAGGGGLDFLIKRIEFGVRVRYDFGFSDILRNRNKYYDNGYDSQTKPGENPFYLTPLRSPLDNLTISLRVGFRIGKEGFKEWYKKREPRPKNKEVFKFPIA